MFIGECSSDNISYKLRLHEGFTQVFDRPVKLLLHITLMIIDSIGQKVVIISKS